MFRDAPDLMRTAARASDVLGQHNQAIGLWCELCWRHPAYAEHHTEAMPECFRVAQAEAEDVLVENAMRATPAWVLMLYPGLARALPELPKQVDAWVRVCEPLAKLVREPHNVAHRQAVRDISPRVLKAFLARTLRITRQR